MKQDWSLVTRLVYFQVKKRTWDLTTTNRIEWNPIGLLVWNGIWEEVCWLARLPIRDYLEQELE